jgi:ParB family chromosome partitioning protein
MTEQLLQLDPTKVQTDDNVRFNLKRNKVDSLSSAILEAGRVLEPVGVQPLDTPSNGFTHKLVYGFYRHAAVDKLNKEQAAGLTLPAILISPASETERLRLQLMENMDRENMSPMDSAVAIKKLMDSGVSRGEIRRIFARPAGKKGAEVQPASNAWVNIVLRFLELPKTIQEKIHTGVIGVEAAYELGKVPPEKRQAVIERAEAERQHQIDVEAKDEQVYLAAEKKLTEAQEKEKEAVKGVEVARSSVEVAQQLVEAKTLALRTIQKEPYLEYDEKQKQELNERLKAATTDLRGAEKALKDAKNAVVKNHDAAKKAADIAAEQRAKLEAARKAVKTKKPNAKEIKKGDIQAGGQGGGRGYRQGAAQRFGDSSGGQGPREGQGASEGLGHRGSSAQVLRQPHDHEAVGGGAGADYGGGQAAAGGQEVGPRGAGAVPRSLPPLQRGSSGPHVASPM